MPKPDLDPTLRGAPVQHPGELSRLNGYLEKRNGEENPFFRQDILSVSQFSRENLNYLFQRSERMRELVIAQEPSNALAGHVMAAVFYEPSTRTSASFLAAMQRLGGGVIPITQGVQFSSVSKGENLPDTMRTLERYSDVIVLRHPEEGSARIAAESAHVPVINAGDGTGEHPTQALLDILTIQEEMGKIDGLHIAMVGDLRFGRTVHSLTKLLMMYNVGLAFVSPDILDLPKELRTAVRANGQFYGEFSKVEDVIEWADVLYVTRVQKERFSQPEEYERVKGSYVITPDTILRAKDNMIIMHPLPRVGEIDSRVDADPRAAYFRQVEAGLYARMALLESVLLSKPVV